MIGQTISHYKILEKLGEGGMGVVYKAEDTKLERIVAIKFLPHHIAANAEERERFKIEAKAAAALNHPNIATIHAIEEVDGDLFIVMEFIDGREIRTLIIGNSQLPIDHCLAYATQIAEGLKAAHAKGVTHRDIKSSNIMVTESGQVKIMDFGLAKIDGGMHLTKSGTTLGTVAYMSPEQARGKKVDHRTDIWSLGVVFYEMLTGVLPFQGEYEQAVIYAVCHEAPGPLSSFRSDMPQDLEAIVSKALAKHVEDRYQEAQDLLAELRRLKGESPMVSAWPAITMKWKPVKKKTWAWTSAIAIVLVLIIWFFIQIILSEHPPSASTSEKSIAVMYFDNRTNETDLDKILVDMLTTNLARYDNLEVVSSQRLFDILKNMGKLEMQSIDRTVATEVANRAGVGTMMLGSIIHIGNTFRLTSQLIDVKTGTIVGSPQADGAKVEEVFSMVDDLTEQVSTTMEIAASANETELLRFAEVTTQSYQAYKYYQKGLEASWRFDRQAATQNFQRAVDFDSTFAMARLQLTYSQSWNGLNNPYWDMTEHRKVLALAEKHSRNASPKERRLILAVQAAYDRDFQRAESLFVDYLNRYPKEKDAAFSLQILAATNGNIERAIHAIERTLELDPAFATGYNNLSYLYSELNEHEKAISANKKYRALQPDVMNAYSHTCDIYLHAGRLDEALRICEEALRKNPGWLYLNNRIAFIYLYKGDGERARYYLSLEGRDPAEEARGMGWIYTYEGRYEKAVEYFTKAAERSLQSHQVPYEAIYAYFDLGKLQTVRGSYEKALAAFTEANKIASQTNAANPVRLLEQYFAGSAMVKEKEFAQARMCASRIQEMVEKEHQDRFYLNYYHLLLAELHHAQGNGRAALTELDKYTAQARVSPRCLTLRAALHAQLGNYEEAINRYENFYNFVVSRYMFLGGDRFDFYYERSKVNYDLAKIYEQKGDFAHAIEYYEKALDQWKHADPEVPELIDAKARLAKLKKQD